MGFISFPAQATVYMIGKFEFMHLLEEAENTLSESIGLKEFHLVILENGSMPRGVLEAVVEGWIEAKLSG